MGTVKFTNNTPAQVDVAYMFRDWTCRDECGDIWNVMGWINLSPGETETRPNPTNNRWFCYYGESPGRVWRGDYPAEVTRSRFAKCTCLGVSVSHGPNPWYTVGMRVVDLDEFSGVTFNI
jgi:hypothetical protein